MSGWRSRGYLPHCDERGLVQHIVFGLDDAMPRPAPDHLDAEQRVQWTEAELDKGYGSRILANAQAAALVEDCLLHGDGERYALAAWCIMPTHAHVLLEQFDGHPLSDVVQKWKSISAHQINKLTGRAGKLWRREYFDRFMRSDEQLAWTIRYVEDNPVAAGLVARPDEWRFSSAQWRRAGGDAGGP